MTAKLGQLNLLNRLRQADVVCKDCGTKYGKYSVGCSSTWNGTCGVCGEDKPVTEVRDWGYLTKGIHAEKAKIKEQSLEVANYIACQEEIASQGEDEPVSYEQGEIACMFTEDEIGFLNECLDTIQEYHPGLKENNLVDVTLFESIEQKITTLYDDYCVKFELSPAMKAYHEKYGTFGIGEDQQRWEGFRDAFAMLNSK